jgi:[CysO sulfur-carrier protein]-S-L-cysteine hydrolase
MAGDARRATRVKVLPPVVRLTETQFGIVVGHCYDGYPDEACGLFIGTMHDGSPTGHVTEARPCRNEAASSIVYTIDGRDLIAATRAADARREEIVGCWHSHTHTDAYPSPTDIAQAAWYPDWLYVIVSLRDDSPMLRAYRVIYPPGVNPLEENVGRKATVHEVPVALDRG